MFALYVLTDSQKMAVLFHYSGFIVFYLPPFSSLVMLSFNYEIEINPQFINKYMHVLYILYVSGAVSFRQVGKKKIKHLYVNVTHFYKMMGIIK